ncbi:MAG: TIGR02186 family protein [Paracoccus sp. (in: a-proteobacteria)]|nr:TIGR02186 family protein [Paracoccus sp. (in: a-proteobacteria)]
MARPPSEPPPPEARPETVVAGLSSDEVAITTNFDGSLITIYGAIKRETPVPTDNKLQVVVTIEGPARSVTIRRKARRFGIWVNTESVVVGSAPSFYAVASTAPLQYILRADEDSRYRITVPTVMRAFARPFDVEDPVEFTEAMIDMRMADGTYLVEPRGVKLEQETLLRADFHLPANLVEGVYRTRIFLLRDGRVVDTYTAPIDVEKVGLERWLYRMAFDQPFLYGLMSLFIAAFAGWGANAGFRILQRK